MNYIVAFRKEGIFNSLFFNYRDESDVAYKEETLIRDEDDVIKAILKYFKPDNSTMVIKETLLDVGAFRDEYNRITEQLKKLLDE
jgi:hypothetical protein|nr:MAG TPA: hypothetical protein [Bacteriophage sp.]